MSHAPSGLYYAEFCTYRYDTGAATAAGSLPVATANHNGVDDAAFVLTVAAIDTGRYKITGTIPSGYAVGDSVIVTVAATVNSIAEKFVVDSFTVSNLDSLLASIYSHILAMGTGAVTVTSCVTEDLDLDLTQYDTYETGGWAAPSFSNIAGTWAAGNLAGWTITLTITNADGVIVLQTTGTIDTATGSQAFHVDLTSEQTALLTSLGNQCKYEVLLVNGTVRQTIVRGAVIVSETLNPPVVES